MLHLIQEFETATIQYCDSHKKYEVYHSTNTYNIGEADSFETLEEALDYTTRLVAV